MSLKVGALFAGYGGIELALGSVFPDVHPAWVAEFDEAPSAILAHHWPDVPNLGDVSKVDWTAVEPVDIITGGSPCQDLSHAGKRAGMKAGTRSGLWASMCDAIDIIRPRLVVWENVRGALSAEATSSVEPCPICVGDGGRVSLRALGRVLGDLAELGYDARWYGLRASDVGGPHARWRVFVFATPADAAGAGRAAFAGELAEQGGARPADAAHPRDRLHDRRGRGGRGGGVGVALLPTPGAYDGQRGGSQSPEQRQAGGHAVNIADVAEHHLLPTPRASKGMNATLRPDGDDPSRLEDAVAIHLLPTPRAQHGEPRNQNIYERPADQPQNLENALFHLLPTPRATRGGSATETRDMLLPTPRATDGTKGGPSQRGSSGDLMMPSAVHQDWREYEPVIRRAEAAWGRPAPAPTELAPNGKHRLAPAFVEWMMGLPEGWVTDPDIGITRNERLKALGNGVVPQQCAAALRAFLADEAAEEAA